MASLSLREAAEQVGVSKSTVFRAIRAGRLSATRDDDGNFRVDASELFRVYEPVRKERTAAERVETQAVTQDALTSDAVELRIRVAELEANLNALKQILEMEKERGERERQDLKAERDRWAAALEASQRQITHLAEKAAPEKRGLFGWLRRAG